MSSISVIIPCYRYGNFLPECLASVLSQTGVDLRVLLLDDASPDDTPRVARALADADARVTYQGQATNQGHIATFNVGLAWADGDYTLLLSADDLLTPGALLRAARLLDAHPEVGLVYGRAVPFTSGQALPAPHAPPGETAGRIIPGHAWLAAACRQAHVPIRSPEVVVRTSLQREVGMYSAALPHSADLLMWLRFSQRAAVGSLADTDQAYYRLHPHNLHKTLAPTIVIDLQHRWEAFEALFQAHGPQLPDGTRLRRAAARRLAREALLAAASRPDDGTAPAVDELVALAGKLYPPTRLTPEYWAWQVRQRLGPRALPLMRQVARRFFRL